MTWDAEEYGLIGSTEFCEEHTELLKQQVVAYMNVDMNDGLNFEVESAPYLAEVIREESVSVRSPKFTNKTLCMINFK
jgi:N-acetylated-alpha-linked acidic dipeptidase